MTSHHRLVIATRASRLALWQAEHVRSALLALYPGLNVELLKLSTRGDEILDRSLSKVGGKGLFVKELENALLDGRADLAVHSLKDVPVDMPDPFKLAVIMARADCRDAFVSNRFDALEALPEGAVVGTSSLRRESQLKARFPHLVIQALRGNLDTRLSKLDSGQYDAIILAAAGLQRLGLADRIRSFLSVEDSMPAAGQGALGIEILQARPDLLELLTPLSCSDSTVCALAERAVSRALGGSCQVPLAAFAQVRGSDVHLRALIAMPDASLVLKAEGVAAADQGEALGLLLAKELLGKGADRIMASLAG